jgi:hypothetical protein
VPEDVTKRVNVTFGTGLPLGEHARFKHEGRIWIAYPIEKNTRIQAVTDRLLGIYSGMLENVARFINSHPGTPGTTDMVVSLLGSIDRARDTYDELNMEKARSRTC